MTFSPVFAMELLAKITLLRDKITKIASPERIKKKTPVPHSNITARGYHALGAQ